MQINYRWHGHAFPSIEDMFDPEWTATYAAQFLRTLYEERGNWAAAAGAYHSLTPELAQKYSARFRTLLAGPAAGGLTDAEALVAAVAPRLLRRHPRPRGARRSAGRWPSASGSPARRRRRRPAASPGRCWSGPTAALLAGPPLLGQGQPLFAAAGGPLF